MRLLRDGTRRRSASPPGDVDGDRELRRRRRRAAPPTPRVTGPRDAPRRVEGAPCEIVLETPEYLPPDHVPVGTPVTYNSNPPSSGPHYPVWAAFKEYDAPVDRGYYVHNLEHGAVVFLYKCEDADGCPDVVQALRDAAATVPSDPLCETATRPSAGPRHHRARSAPRRPRRRRRRGSRTGAVRPPASLEVRSITRQRPRSGWCGRAGRRRRRG